MKPTIVLDNEVHRKVMHWVHKSPVEVSGFGTVEVEKDGVIRVVSAMLLPQKNGPAHTNIEADAICKALFELKDARGEMLWWWHSHVNMGVFWSGTDHQAMRDFSGQGEDHWICATVFNKKGETRSAFYAPKGAISPWGANALFYDECELKIEDFVDPRQAEWDAEYKKNVTDVKQAETKAVVTYGSYGDLGDYGWEDSWRHSRPRWEPEGGPRVERAVPKFQGLDKLLEGLTPEQIKAAALAKNTRGRPKGVTKAQFKHIKAMLVDVRGQTNDDGPSEEKELKDWGLNQEQIDTFIRAGWEDADLTEFIVERNFHLMDLLYLATDDLGPLDIQDLLDQGFSPSQIRNCANQLITGDPTRLQA